MPNREPTRVALEVAKGRTFASAVDWPGWCRSGKDPAAALAALAGYAPRYAALARSARVRFSPAYGDELGVVDEVPGDGTTTFGAPGSYAATDRQSLTAAEADRQVRLLRAAWRELDRLAVEAPEALRKGPRGGGRDRDAVIDHVIEAERSYARKVGVRHPPFRGDVAALGAFRDELGGALRAARDARPLVTGGWLPRYFLRRAAWHAVDHVWEIEDRSAPEP